MVQKWLNQVWIQRNGWGCIWQCRYYLKAIWRGFDRKQMITKSSLPLKIGFSLKSEESKHSQAQRRNIHLGLTLRQPSTGWDPRKMWNYGFSPRQSAKIKHCHSSIFNLFPHLSKWCLWESGLFASIACASDARSISIQTHIFLTLETYG